MTATAVDDLTPLDQEVVGWVDLAKTGDQHAYAQIYDRYVGMVYGYVYRRVGGQKQLAEDLVGDVFLRGWRRMSTFEWQGVDFGAWLMTIARNRVNDHYKSARYRLDSTAGEIYDPKPTMEMAVDSPERIAIARDMARSLGAALEQLKDDHREVVELRFVHGMSVSDTAATMQRTIGATKALQYRALRALAELVKNEPGLAELAAASLATLIAALGGLA